jgi:hypothetical protein
LVFEFEQRFSGKLFQGLLILTTHEFSAASTPTRRVRSLSLCALVVLALGSEAISQNQSSTQGNFYEQFHESLSKPHAL